MSQESTDRREWEYVVVGSGAGGGTVAARLAELAEVAVEVLTCFDGEVAIEDVLQQAYDARPADVGLGQAAEEIASPARRTAGCSIVAA